jgi:alpha-galactosidase
MLPDGAVELAGFSLTMETEIDDNSRLFCNGFQSWTETREYPPSEKIKKLFAGLRLIKLHRLGDSHFYKYTAESGRLHGYTYTYIKNADGGISFAGSLSEDEGYTIFEHDALKRVMNITKECEGLIAYKKTVIMDLLLADGDENKIFDRYAALHKPKIKPSPLCTGWTSWYNYYTDISEEIIIENLEAYTSRGITIDTFQIDDGWQTYVGDWLSIKPSFPKGMKFIASSIKSKRFKAGLWLAPFICDKKSAVFREHPEWLLKDSEGRPVPAGWNPLWNGTFYCLNIYHPGFVRHLRKVFSTVLNEWGYDMVKLDFLYAAAMLPVKGRSRGRVMRDAMELLRELCGKKIILGCGVPLGSAFGLVEYCRIGSDVALSWEDWRLKLTSYRERVSTVNSLTSTIGRRHLNGRFFVNDPDVIILRSENNSLSVQQRRTLAVINNIFGGLIFTSDNISSYKESEMALYRSTFPLREKIIKRVDQRDDLYIIEFSIGSLEYIVYSNFSAASRGAVLDKGIFFVKKNESGEFVKGSSRVVLYPFETRIYLKADSKRQTAVGSEGHIFPCSEIKEVKMAGRRIKVVFEKGFSARSKVFIRVPREGDYTINGVKAEAVLHEGGLITVSADI